MKTTNERDKNALWLHDTPNSEYIENPKYKELVDKYGEFNEVLKPWKFQEVRLLKTRSVLWTPDDLRWWELKEFQEKVFWVFVRPYFLRLKEFRQAQEYSFLEPLESMRVKAVLEIKHGRNKRWGPLTSFLLPTDCWEFCWDETRAGKYEHRRENTVAPPSKEQVEKHEALTEAGKELIEQRQVQVDVPGMDDVLHERNKRHQAN